MAARSVRALALSWVVALWALGVVGCGEETGDGGGPGATFVGDGDFRVRVTDESLTLERRGEELVVLGPDAFVMGRVEAVRDEDNYDPYPLAAGEPTAKEWAGLAWLAGESWSVESAGASEVVLTVEHAGGGLRSRVTLALGGDGRFEARFVPEDATSVALLRVRPRVGAEEAFYGLGEYFDAVEHRGKVRAMQLELSGKLESSNNEAHVPVPFVIGTRGWGMFVESPYPGAFDLAAADAERVEATFGTGVASGEGLVVHLFGADHPLDVTRRYYDVTGDPRVPARWALGPLVWRDENVDQAQFESDLNQMRDLDLAATGVWIDRPYATGVNTFDFDAAKFPDPAGMISLAQSLGFRMALWHTPYLDDEDPATEALRGEAIAGGFYPEQAGIQVNPWGTMIDLTKPEAKAWWQSHVQSYVDMGIEGFKLDYGEDIVPGVFGARNYWKLAAGDERTLHSLFQLDYHSTYAELLTEGSFLLCRGGTYGDQKNVDVIWPGDLDATFAKQGDVVDDGGETYTSVGGLPASVIAGLTLGPSGFPLYGADTGGYRHSPPDKELFIRWFQQTALSSVMQVGTSTNDVAWEPTPENGFDAEVLELYREYARLHLRLWPYAWTYVTRLALDGRPLQRALGLAHPELGVHPDDVYLFGDHLLVAPVVERGQVQKQVLFPAGEWVDWFSGERFSTNEASVDAPLSKLPLFLRAGGVVPMLRPTIDAIAPTTDPARVDSYATTPGVLYVRTTPGEASSFALFDGAQVGQAPTDDGFELSAKAGDEFAHGFVFEVIATGEAPSAVTNGGAALPVAASIDALETMASGWAFVGAELGGLLVVKLPAGEHAIRVVR